MQSMDGNREGTDAAAVVDALQELGGNLLRVMRGAGKPDRLLFDAIAVADAVRAYQTKFGGYPDPRVLSDALSIQPTARSPFSLSDRELAELKVIQGSLQVVASRLLGQLTQETSGRSELYEGMKALTSR